MCHSRQVLKAQFQIIIRIHLLFLTLTGFSSRWSQSLRWLTRVNASGMLSPSEQKISITAREMSSVQLTRQKNSIGWIHNYRFDRTVWFMPVLPVCVKSFGHSSSGNVEPLLWVRDPGKRTDPLHLPPAQLLHPLSLLLLQRRSQQVPQRSAAQTKDHQTITFEY